MLNIKNLRRKSKTARLAKQEHIKWAKERKRVEGLALVGKAFTPCLTKEWEEKIKVAAGNGENDICIPLNFDNKFNIWQNSAMRAVCPQYDDSCYTMLFDLAKTHFKPQGFKCYLKTSPSRYGNPPQHRLKIKW